MKNTVNRHLQLIQIIGSDMEKSSIAIFLALALVGCNETIEYGIDHAKMERSLVPIFNTSCRYRCGKHDLDLGRVDCIFDVQCDRVQIVHDLVDKYEKDGWRLIQKQDNRLTFGHDTSRVEVEVKDALYVTCEN